MSARHLPRLQRVQLGKVASTFSLNSSSNSNLPRTVQKCLRTLGHVQRSPPGVCDDCPFKRCDLRQPTEMKKKGVSEFSSITRGKQKAEFSLRYCTSIPHVNFRSSCLNFVRRPTANSGKQATIVDDHTHKNHYP
eukprot:402302-Amphidinium_carterae.1